MSNSMNLDVISQSIQRHFADEIEKIIQEIIDEATKELVWEIRRKTGSIAAQLLNGFDYMQDQHRLVITVKFNELLNGQ